ncbi:MAG: hypothetical protein A3I00_04370 [Betaproteobacteria bacterium RIFCSPLOWO2_02_FULL_64_12]|nr:MAG: hypothetical protein A3I00_04370 [Betaproteobacteria bacterium RIFCSPLOWO2_02_FULL_64_12]
MAHSRPQGAVALAAVAAGTAIALGVPQPRLAALLLIGVLCGVTLYHSAFGFTAAYRNFLFRRDGTGVKAQLLMLAVATVLFAPVLASGGVFGREVAGASASFGWQVAIGAFFCGAGMQLGGGCGSGTLYALAGGNARMLATLLAFCAGGFWASLHMESWQELPHSGELVLGEALGWPAAVALQLSAIAVLYAMVRTWEARRAPAAAPPKWERIFTGPWSLATGAVALALLNLATLLVSGHPWSITWAFTLWGAKAARAIGWDPSVSPFWNNPFQREALEASILADETSVMDIGILAGALLASALAARFAPTHRVPARSLAAAIAGGLLMGYGARIAYGCNIGAFFSGVASTSLHGWLWIAAALPGTWLGARARPFFGLPV